METDLRVLHVRSSAGLYGAEYVILALIPALRKFGIDGTLLCLDNQYTDEQELWSKACATGISSRRIPCHGRFDFATLAALRRALTESPRAIMHVHDYKSAAHAWLARGRGRNPIIATMHGQFASTSALRFYHRLELALMTRFDGICIVADAMRANLVRTGTRAQNIRLIENGIDTARFAPTAVAIPRWEFGIEPGAVVFGSAMRLTEQKNPLGLVDAFAQVVAQMPQAVLVVAGGGHLREPALRRAGELGIADRVRFVGPRKSLESFYRMLDVFVLPSLYEGLPLALLEAMATQCRIVATCVGEVANVLAGLEAGLVAAGDSAVLAKAMLDVARCPRSRPAMRERVVERYSVARMAAAYAGVYREFQTSHERAAA
jgi:glycosyltransferase involved in cell wall biosynthesis